MRLADRIKHGFANRGYLLTRHTSHHRDQWMREISRVASERTLLLSHGEACQILSALQSTAHLSGDIAELGVAYGASAKLIAMHAGARVVHLFDTFAGLPSPKSLDSPRFRHGDFKSQLESVKAYLGASESLRFHPGMFPETAAAVSEKTFSFVHLDADLYESTLAGLVFFYPRMMRGGIIISHDYLSADGVDRAFGEFFRDKPERPMELASGYQCMVLKL